MQQLIPKVNETDIFRILQRDYSTNIDFVMQILTQYHSTSKKGKNRVYAAILKLSKGDIKKVRDFTDKAINDYRDVLALAESPNYSNYVFNDDLLEAEENKLIIEDWEQYQLWFNK